MVVEAFSTYNNNNRIKTTNHNNNSNGIQVLWTTRFVIQNDHHYHQSVPSISLLLPKKHHQQQQQQRNIRITKRSAVAYGNHDDSEWYYDPSSSSSSSPSSTRTTDTTTTATTSVIPTTFETMNDSIQPKLEKVGMTTSLNHDNYRHHQGKYTVVQYTTITSVQQFHDILNSPPSISVMDRTSSRSSKHDDDDDDLEFMIVKFYTPYCKSCQKIGMKIDQFITELSNDDDDTSGGTKTQQQRKRKRRRRRLHIVQIDYSIGTNRELFRQYNIKQLPTLHVYHHPKAAFAVNYEKVLDMPCPPHLFYKVRELYSILYYNNNHSSNNNDHYVDDIDDDTILHDLTTTTASVVLDNGHQMIESSVLPMLQSKTNNDNMKKI